MKIQIYKGGIHLVCDEKELTIIRDALMTRFSDYDDTTEARSLTESMIHELDHGKEMGDYNYVYGEWKGK